MKTLLLKIALPRLALLLAGSRQEVIDTLRSNIAVAEQNIPKRPDNSHRAARINWVRSRAASIFSKVAPWALNAIIEMLFAHLRITKGARP